MALTIEHPDADPLAKELADATGEDLTEAVMQALRERLNRVRRSRRDGLASEIRRIGRECAALPEFDRRAPDEILAYGDDGLPH